MVEEIKIGQGEGRKVKYYVEFKLIFCYDREHEDGYD